MAKLFKTTTNHYPISHHLFGIELVIFNSFRYNFIVASFRGFSIKAF